MSTWTLSEKVELSVRICRDPRLSDAQCRVATVLLLYFHNTRSGECFPSLRQLAEASNTSQGTAVRAIAALEGAEYLTVERSDGGRNRRSVYLFKHSTNGAFNAANTPLVEQEHSTGGPPCSTGGASNTPLVQHAYIRESNPGINHLNIARKRRARSSLPETWSPPSALISNLVEKGFSVGEINGELEAFSDHHRAKGNLMADWSAAYRLWMRNSRKFSARANGTANSWRPDGPSGAGYCTASSREFTAHKEHAKQRGNWTTFYEFEAAEKSGAEVHVKSRWPRWIT